MKIYLREITDQETEYNFTQEEPWVCNAISRIDEEPVAPKSTVRPSGVPTPSTPERTAAVHLSFRKVDDVIVVSGDIETSIHLLCSRCGVPFHLSVSPRVSALFCKDPVMAGVAHIQDSGRNKGKPVGQNKGHARHAHDASQDHEAGGGGMDLDITYLSEDYIDLADILTEQLQLQVPFQPLCKADCKGVCTTCGTDLNTGRCACSKLNKASPFSVLENLKSNLKM